MGVEKLLNSIGVFLDVKIWPICLCYGELPGFLFCLQVFDIFDEKKNGVIEFEEFVHALNVFHPYAPVEEKIDCKKSQDF